MTRGLPVLFLGVDGGGSGCRVALARADGTVLARAERGPANVTSDFDGALANLRAAIHEALSAAGLDESALAACRAHAGLAGVVTRSDADRVRAALPPARWTVTDDRPTALAGALGGQDGALICVGTGSFLISRRGAALRTIGGWGFQLSDQGSGAWLGRALLEETLLAHDGLAAFTDLTRAVLIDFGGAPDRIVAFAGQAGPQDYARLARKLTEAAAAGDDTGRAIMARGASYLTRALAALDLAGNAPLCLSGGLGPSYAPYLSPPLAARLRAPAGTALDGALLLAGQDGAP
ncbi:BadF/BadG/BcrA/BcrD ATPase family protein [Poseidonocella sedimentorum]|uniref:Glucosamine kinase n=1 Tax=Poseidonocella sedimentorum TaxID=871652 RepID=A0A1I6ER39_9RHOB|nr:BadF/BadG/BcrA/BcrD ATPase family protein [Poseidonocella sedimentorum]SFR20229.1 glucosamine kinase [Poseidonocella sedimentorum]